MKFFTFLVVSTFQVLMRNRRTHFFVCSFIFAGWSASSWLQRAKVYGSKPSKSSATSSSTSVTSESVFSDLGCFTTLRGHQFSVCAKSLQIRERLIFFFSFLRLKHKFFFRIVGLGQIFGLHTWKQSEPKNDGSAASSEPRNDCLFVCVRER